MTNEDAIKWLENLKQDIGQLRHEDLWPYAQAIDEIMELLEEQESEIRQLRLALDIAKGTCKGIKSGGGQYADMPTMQSAT